MIESDRPFFSVIIPVFNAEKYLHRCINSILFQSFERFEAIFIDDGSTDTSAHIIESYNDSRIRLFQQRNKGVSTARNVGIKKSTGEFIAFIDADDEWFSNHLEIMYKIIKACKLGVIYFTGYRIVFEKQNPTIEISVDTEKNLYTVIKNPFPMWSVAAVNIPSNTVIPKKIIDKSGGFKYGEKENEDMELWIRIAAESPIVVASSIVTSIYHNHGNTGKPRFHTYPKYILSCDTAISILNDKENEKVNRNALRKYIKSWIGKYFWKFVMSNAREPLKVVLQNSQASIYAPTYYWLGHKKSIWIFIRMFGILRAVPKSIILLRLVGGVRKNKGVMIKLIMDSKFSWKPYIFKKHMKGRKIIPRERTCQ